MGRARLVLAAVVVSLCARDARAQTPTPAEGWVVLPVDEYRALREGAFPPPAIPAPPPVDATITRIDYELRADTDAVTGRVVLSVDVLREGFALVQLPPGLMAREASIDGQPVPIVEGPQAHVVLSRAG